MNPSLYVNDSGALFLDFHIGGDVINPAKCSTRGWYGAYVQSTDYGVTWSNITYLPKGFLAGIKNKCITLSSGRVLCPSSTEAVDYNLLAIWRAHMETTDQDWVSWETSNEITFSHNSFHLCQGVIQPTLFEITEHPGEVLALMRSGCKCLAKSKSYDYGRTWQDSAEATDLPNPGLHGSGVDGVRMFGDGVDLGLILVINNSTRERCPLTLVHSGDLGATWEHVLDIEGDCELLGATYEYPAVVQGRRNQRSAHVCYSYNSNDRTMAYSRLEWS
eukprot:TRINITY_DN4031_c0_g1_i3.p1 TRINITY_DN4031_c0_g1~~TRINITY_DN4031_c0_g1_i3.p1  ORF type:complete len:275 (+),score=28.52 TRINITY_DN4031_c0_g1_i3:343-1167(+)